MILSACKCYVVKMCNINNKMLDKERFIGYGIVQYIKEGLYKNMH